MESVYISLIIIGAIVFSVGGIWITSKLYDYFEKRALKKNKAEIAAASDSSADGENDNISQLLELTNQSLANLEGMLENLRKQNANLVRLNAELQATSESMGNAIMPYKQVTRHEALFVEEYQVVFSGPEPKPPPKF